jgi:hypothetical protein
MKYLIVIGATLCAVCVILAIDEKNLSAALGWGTAFVYALISIQFRTGR